MNGVEALKRRRAIAKPIDACNYMASRAADDIEMIKIEYGLDFLQFTMSFLVEKDGEEIEVDIDNNGKTKVKSIFKKEIR